jgi:hypothetical protein
MAYGTMARNVLLSALAMLAVGSSVTTVPVRAEAAAPSTSLRVAQAGRYGPYATARRANEVAYNFRSRGYSAQVYPEWGAYYVSVW